MPIEVVTWPSFEGIDHIEYVDKENSVAEGGIGGVVISDSYGLGRNIDVAGQRLAISSVHAVESRVRADGGELGGERDDNGCIDGNWHYCGVEFKVDGVVLAVDGEAIVGGLVDFGVRCLHTQTYVFALASRHQCQQDDAVEERGAFAMSQIM